MTKQTFYGDALPKLEAAERQLVSLCTQCPLSHELDGESPAVLSCISRIKSPDSMIAKLRGRGLPCAQVDVYETPLNCATYLAE